MATDKIYDAMAGTYLHGSTTTLFRTIQSEPIRKYLAYSRGMDGRYSDMKILIVGPGPAGNVEEWINQASLRGGDLDEINPRNITYLDNSANMISLCQKHVAEEVTRRVGKSGYGRFVCGSGEELVQYFAAESFDVIIAALCDHMETERFFEQAAKILKPGGSLIVSFPADGLNRVVREQIYEIPSDYTRFKIEGTAYLVPSRLMTALNLKGLLARSGFIHHDAVEVPADKHPATKTVVHAAALMGCTPQGTPLVVVGVGQKGHRA